ncbi:MAG: hypothetical protein ACI8TP_000719 [Acidimicrobiales bacterium]
MSDQEHRLAEFLPAKIYVSEGVSARQQDESEWLRTALGGTGTGLSRPYLVRPSAQDPQLLLPLRPTAAARTSLRRYHDDRSASERMTGLAGEAIGRLGLLKLAGGEEIELEPFALIEMLAPALGEPVLIPAVSLGPRRRNRKPVVQLLRPDGIAVGFAKVGWSPFTAELIANEAHWLNLVDGKLPHPLRSPAVLHQASFDQGNGRIDVVVSSPLPTSVSSHRSAPIPIEPIVALARIASGGRIALPDLPLVTSWRQSPLADLVDLDALVERHRNVEIEVGLWHGDLTPWNTATERGITAVWDWEFAGDGRPVGFDAMHIAFETVRRAAHGNEAKAVAAVIATTPAILNSIPGRAVATSADAVIDLYLCELLHRESRLAGEGWRPEHLAPLDEQLRDALNLRLTA